MQIKDENEMGKVLTDLTVINRVDQAFTEAGYISEEEIRS